MICRLCNQSSEFAVIAVRFDGELLDNADYCRRHALELALSRHSCQLRIRSEHLGAPLDQCYRDRCDCLPKKLSRCARCTKLADVWLVSGTQSDLEDLERGVNLCGPCAISEVANGKLPAETLRELREAVDRKRGLLH